jgi:hypothetical protein
MLFDRIKNLLCADPQQSPSSAMIRDELRRLEATTRRTPREAPCDVDRRL